MRHKSFIGTVLKLDDNTGTVEAVFARMNVKDHDGDVTLPGNFEDGAHVRISAFNHKSWQDALPVGRGTIHEDGDDAVLRGKFFTNTTHGKDTYLTVKGLSENPGIQEWSYGFDPIDSGPGTFDGESVNLLRKSKVHEVSPVLLGAGIGTHTRSVKSLTDMTDSELADEFTRIANELDEKGIAWPEGVLKAVKDRTDAEALVAEGKALAMSIAAYHGIDLTPNGTE